jgi:NADH:ubiquinone oxidoreductase subunit F (NADH-binding)
MPLVERVLDRTECRSLSDHTDRGGGRGLQAARAVAPDVVIDELAASGLRGRGGGGFPTGTKWRSVLDNVGATAPTVVVNAAEGEPGTFKDRQLLRANPYKVLEGALIAAHVVDAAEVVVAMKGSFDRELRAVRRAGEELHDAGWTDGVDLHIVEGPSAYLFGEETAMLEVIAGRQPFPRVAPPYRRGVEAPTPGGSNPASDVELVGDPTGVAAPALANNVETLANVPAIVAEGAEWFRRLGTVESPGTIVCTMTGRCATHAVGEVPMGTTLREAIELIGDGAAHGRVTGALSGVANPIVPEHLLDTPLSYESMREIGSGLGAAGFHVMDDTTDVLALAAGVARFLSVESCGQCEPCKRDGLEIADRLAERGRLVDLATEAERLGELLDTVTRGARCALATQQQRVVSSVLELYPEALRDRPADVSAVEPILPLVDIVDGRAVLDTSHLAKQPDWSHGEVDSGAWPAALGQPIEVGVGVTRTVTR